MNLMHESLARAHYQALLADAEERRRGHRLVLAHRLARRAERTAARARVQRARVG